MAKRITVEDLWKIERPAQPTLSPDGAQACVVPDLVVRAAVPSAAIRTMSRTPAMPPVRTTTVADAGSWSSGVALSDADEVVDDLAGPSTTVDPPQPASDTVATRTKPAMSRRRLVGMARR